MNVHFNKKDNFRIAQLTDVHLNHYPFDENDAIILSDIERTIEKIQPDLIMITGDVVNTYKNPEERSIFKSFFEFLNRFAMPKAITYGNHDSESELTRKQLEELFDEIVENKVDRKQERVLDGRSNYCVEVLDRNTQHPQQVLYVMDSGKVAPGENSTDDWIYPGQVEWFSKTAANYMGFTNNLLFLHIPLPEYSVAKDNVLSGELREPNKLISTTKINTGLFSQLYFSKQIYGVFCGHNHLNNAEFLHEGIHLFYGMFSGRETKAGDFRGIRYIDVLESGQKIQSEIVFYKDV